MAVLHIYTGHLTDRVAQTANRRGDVAGGGRGVALVAGSHGMADWLTGALLMGEGMALLCPNLIVALLMYETQPAALFTPPGSGPALSLARASAPYYVQ